MKNKFKAITNLLITIAITPFIFIIILLSSFYLEDENKENLGMDKDL
jgi:hypothetical protein